MGTGQWYLNTDLLKDLHYVNHIKDNWVEFQEYRKDFENAKDWWDAAKHMVRSLNVVYSIQRKQVERELKKALMKETENIENLLEINYCENKVKELDIIKKRIKDIEDKKAEGHRIWARVPRFEETEPIITYYAKLGKSRSEKNLIYSLYKKMEIFQ